MTILKMYEKINLVTKLEQRRFFNYYEDTINELRALYGDKYLFTKDTDYVPPESLSDTSVLLPLYEDAVIDNILYKAKAGGEGNDVYKTEFIRKSQEAYLEYWHSGIKGRRIRKIWGW